jgi:hypothetical protein
MVLFPLPLGAEKIKRKDLSPALSKGEGEMHSEGLF